MSRVLIVLAAILLALAIGAAIAPLIIPPSAYLKWSLASHTIAVDRSERVIHGSTFGDNTEVPLPLIAIWIGIPTGVFLALTIFSPPRNRRRPAFDLTASPHSPSPCHTPPERPASPGPLFPDGHR